MKNYRIEVKMIATTEMNHKQQNKEKAIADVKKLIENLSKEGLNELFTSKPKFTYKIKIIETNQK